MAPYAPGMPAAVSGRTVKAGAAAWFGLSNHCRPYSTADAPTAHGAGSELLGGAWPYSAAKSWNTPAPASQTSNRDPVNTFSTSGAVWAVSTQHTARGNPDPNVTALGGSHGVASALPSANAWPFSSAASAAGMSAANQTLDKDAAPAPTTSMSPNIESPSTTGASTLPFPSAAYRCRSASAPTNSTSGNPSPVKSSHSTALHARESASTTVSVNNPAPLPVKMKLFLTLRLQKTTSMLPSPFTSPRAADATPATGKPWATAGTDDSCVPVAAWRSVGAAPANTRNPWLSDTVTISGAPLLSKSAMAHHVLLTACSVDKSNAYGAKA